MGETFGTAWARNFDDPDSAIAYWYRSLCDERLTPEDVARGFAALRESGDQFPPSLPRFVALCRKPAGERREHAAMYREFQKALPPPRDPQKARAALDTMRKAVTKVP